MVKQRGDTLMEDICKKFPKICNCPYKDDIDNDLQKGKTPYYIAKWLKKTECPISEDTIRRYQRYLLENDGIPQQQQSPSHTEEALITQLENKAKNAILSLDMDHVSDNVKVQLILGACKLIYGSSHQIQMNADVTSENKNTHNLDNEVLKVLSDALQRRNNKST